MSDWIFDHHGGFGHGEIGATGYPHLGPEYVLTDEGELISFNSAQAAASTTSHLSTAATPAATSPVSTLVGPASGLQINLAWDFSIRTASNWQAIEQAVTQAAKIYTTAFANHLVLNIHVGLGEVGGTALDAGALGESQTSGYLVSYAAASRALAAADSGLVTSGLMAAGAAADAALAGKTFFVPSAEAKALGLASPTGTGVDGYIGLTGDSSLFFAGGGGQIGARQYDAVGVAAHELSEVMGRIGMEGSGAGYYTPLDLFRFSGAHQPDLAPTAGYFSMNFGVTSLNAYNNPAHGGDAGDWASSAANARDAYDAFANPGVVTIVSKSDLLEVAALGFHPASPLAPVTA